MDTIILTQDWKFCFQINSNANSQNNTSESFAGSGKGVERGLKVELLAPLRVVKNQGKCERQYVGHSFSTNLIKFSLELS